MSDIEQQLVSALQEQIITAHKVIESLEERLADSQSSERNAKREVDNAQRETRSLRISEAARSLSTTRDQQSRVDDESLKREATLQGENENLKAEVQRLREKEMQDQRFQEVETLRSENENLNQKVIQLTADHTGLRDTVSSLQKNLDSLMRLNRSLETYSKLALEYSRTLVARHPDHESENLGTLSDNGHPPSDVVDFPSEYSPEIRGGEIQDHGVWRTPDASLLYNPEHLQERNDALVTETTGLVETTNESLDTLSRHFAQTLIDRPLPERRVSDTEHNQLDRRTVVRMPGAPRVRNQPNWGSSISSLLALSSPVPQPVLGAPSHNVRNINKYTASDDGLTAKWPSVGSARSSRQDPGPGPMGLLRASSQGLVSLFSRRKEAPGSTAPKSTSSRSSVAKASPEQVPRVENSPGSPRIPELNIDQAPLPVSALNPLPESSTPGIEKEEIEEKRFDDKNPADIEKNAAAIRANEEVGRKLSKELASVSDLAERRRLMAAADDLLMDVYIVDDEPAITTYHFPAEASNQQAPSENKKRSGTETSNDQPSKRPRTDVYED